MKKYTFLLLFALLIIISSCKRKCSYCETTFSGGGSAYRDICRKEFDSKTEWEAEVKYYEEELDAVCTEHR